MSTDLKILALDEHTVSTEGICCAFSDKKHKPGVQLKQDWLKARFAEGLQYKRLNVRGKVFIEYIPAEYAWSPVDAPNYMFIHCFWVSGQYKGQGWGRQLLEECCRDAEGKHGVAVIVTKKVMPFTVDKKFFVKHGFEVCDAAPPYFELLVKRFHPDAPQPRFRDTAKSLEWPNSQGFTFVYADLCPFLPFWTAQMVKVAEQHGIPCQTVQLTTREAAQNFTTAFPMFSLFYQGQFVTYEMMADKKFEKFIAKLQ